MKLALCQYDICWEDKAASKKKILSLLDSFPRSEEIDWLVFSEMTLSGFTMNAAAAELDDTDREFFSSLASGRKINISYGGAEGGCNKLITVGRDGRRVSEYSKIHLYAFGGEDKHYKPGSERVIFTLEGLRVMPAICFDIRFPYLFWGAAPEVDMYLAIAAWPMRRAEQWQTMLRARAVENQAYCAGVGRVGFEGKIEYSGNSICYDPLGKVAGDAGTLEGITLCEVDPSLVARTRERFPFLGERRQTDWS